MITEKMFVKFTVRLDSNSFLQTDRQTDVFKKVYVSI